MNGKYPFYISSVCRLCIRGDGTMSIFGDNDIVKVSLKQKIAICLALEVSIILII